MKIVKLLPIIAFLFILTSCIDYIQSINFEKGKYQIYYKITLSKVLFAMADSDPSEIFEEIADYSSFGFPKNVFAKKVDNELEVGVEFSILIDPKTKDETEKSLLPIVLNDEIYIPFLLGKNNEFTSEFQDSNDESNAIAAAFLSSAKCRILISKNLVSSISSAFFRNENGETLDIPFYDYGSTFCIELPFITTFYGESNTISSIIIKK